MLFTKINIIISPELMDIEGTSLSILYIVLASFIVACNVVIILNRKQVNEKVIPFLIFMILMIIVLL